LDRFRAATAGSGPPTHLSLRAATIRPSRKTCIRATPPTQSASIDRGATIDPIKVRAGQRTSPSSVGNRLLNGYRLGVTERSAHCREPLDWKTV
jgi:hypothetical protein